MDAGAPGVDRRARSDRRVSRLSIRYPDRRHGFERRLDGRGPIGTGYHLALRAYRERPAVIAIVLAAMLTLNLADLLVTLRALELGAVEANPLMAALLASGTGLAAAFKVTLGLVAAIGLWSLRKYRHALEASLAITGVLGLVVAYGAFGVVGAAL